MGNSTKLRTCLVFCLTSWHVLICKRRKGSKEKLRSALLPIYNTFFSKYNFRFWVGLIGKCWLRLSIENFSVEVTHIIFRTWRPWMRKLCTTHFSSQGESNLKSKWSTFTSYSSLGYNATLEHNVVLCGFQYKLRHGIAVCFLFLTLSVQYNFIFQLIVSHPCHIAM